MANPGFADHIAEFEAYRTKCMECGWSDEQLDDALNVALVVGGSITIPHLRRAVETIDLVRT